MMRRVSQLFMISIWFPPYGTLTDIFIVILFHIILTILPSISSHVININFIWFSFSHRSFFTSDSDYLYIYSSITTGWSKEHLLLSHRSSSSKAPHMQVVIRIIPQERYFYGEGFSIDEAKNINPPIPPSDISSTQHEVYCCKRYYSDAKVHSSCGTYRERNFTWINIHGTYSSIPTSETIDNSTISRRWRFAFITIFPNQTLHAAHKISISRLMKKNRMRFF